MDKFKFTQGIFKLYSEDKNGNIEVIEEDKNTIVDTAFDIVQAALLGDNTKRLDTIAFGDGGISGGVRVSPNVKDVYLANETFRKAEYESVVVESIIKPYYIAFKFVLAEDEANGSGAMLFNEAGLFAHDGTMFARKTFREAIKTPEKKFIVEWKLEYNAESNI